MNVFGKLALAATCAVLPIAAQAGPIVTGFNGTTLARADDSTTGAVDLGFTANFFGTSYTQAFVGNNGYITFGRGQTTYTPTGLGSDYVGLPIIAAFFADVDTRNLASGVVTYGTGTYGGRNAFAATWTDVGYFNAKADKTNTFQILLQDRSDTGAGNYDLFLNYGKIQWETGDVSGGANGFGGVSAAVGYNAGTGNAPGTYYEFPGSRTPGSFLDTGTSPLIYANTTFQGRSGAAPVAAVPEPASWAMLLLGFGMMGAALRYRRRTTTVAYAA